MQFNVDTEWPMRNCFCTYISEWRSVGCCAYAAALLWYLSISQAGEHNKFHALCDGHVLLSNNDSVQLSDVDDRNDNLESSEADSTKNTDDSKKSEDAVMWDNLSRIPVYPNRLGHVSNMYLVYKYRAADHRGTNKSKNTSW